MTNFLLNYWDSIVAVIVFVIAIVVMIRQKQIKQVKAILLYLVTKAEEQFGGGTGQLKYSAVTTWLYERLPFIAKLFLTEKEIDKLIEDAVEKMKKYLEANKQAYTYVTK